MIHIKLRELQGKDTSEDISDQILLLEHAPEGMAEVLPSDTHIAEPDTVSLREDNAENVSHSGDKMPASDGERDKPTTGNDAPATSEAAKAREEPSPPETAENVATLASTSPHSDDINEMDNDTSLNAEKAGEHTEKSPEEDKNAKNDSKGRYNMFFILLRILLLQSADEIFVHLVPKLYNLRTSASFT